MNRKSISDVSRYGTCCDCGAYLKPVYFLQEEEKTEGGVYFKTGRIRRAVDYLVCLICLQREPVDDTFDGPWVDKDYK